MEKTKNSAWALTAILAGATLLGLSAIFVRWSEASPSITAFYRALFALPFLLLWVYFGTSKKKVSFNFEKKTWIFFILSGAFFGVDMALWNWSIYFTSVAHATLMANTAPVFVCLISFFILRNHIQPIFFIALILGLLGVIIVIGAGSGSNSSRLLGDSFGLFAAIFYAGYILSIKRLTVIVEPPQVLLVSTFFTALFLLPVSLIESGDFFSSSYLGWQILFGYALVSQVFAQGLITFGISRLSAHFSSLTLLVQPIAATIFGIVLLGEFVNKWQIIGGVVVLSSIYLANATEKTSPN
jgi:drug/metabolite transporter (DMT)-like permease|tara:strand:- start:277 stop:1170 length:894 start_codon:yes stop_codon:yes gene_type:complete